LEGVWGNLFLKKVSPRTLPSANPPKEKTIPTILSIAKAGRMRYNKSTATGAGILKEKEVM